MFYMDLLFALVIALLLALVFIPVAPRRSYDESPTIAALWFFFLIVFLATWAGGVWLTPFGPTVWGAYWAPFLMVGILVALLLAAAAEPTRRAQLRRPAEPSAAEAAAVSTAFGIFFWVLIAALAVAVVAAYLTS